jgi:A/G-specific adenine glycosylase
MEFNEILWDFYAHHSRNDLPWRQPNEVDDFDPYAIVVSELMLQQTQVQRVIPKFNEFMRRFPTVRSLAEATLGDVLQAWSGLGYNRRAKFLWQTAQNVQDEYGGHFPQTIEQLVTLPGIGKNTAGAIMAYAFNRPVVYIETNIRTVYIYHFFPDQTVVADNDLLPLINATVDIEHPREFYWALMDYGSYLKQAVGNLSKNSSTYTRQSKFEGSRRQVRGQILRQLAHGRQTRQQLSAHIHDERLNDVIEDLINEGMVGITNNQLHL